MPNEEGGDMTEEKISCCVCKKDIPKSAAMSAEGEEYVRHYCSLDCMDFYKKNKPDKKDDK